ncbi:hypothetical protein CYMTET_51757, partial [Cymbomonas tetramitiformis]
MALRGVVWAALWCAALVGEASAFHADILMPNVSVPHDEAYLATYIKLPENAAYILGFEPLIEEGRVHHLLLFGCTTPNVKLDDGKSDARMGMGSVCGDRSESILYGWAMDAPALKLPKGHGFPVGNLTDIHYIAIQVHYMFKLKDKDTSGIRLLLGTSETVIEKYVGTFGMIVEDLTIPPGKEAVDVSVECVNGLEIPIQALAFRVHAHGLGVYNRLDRAGLGGIFGSNDVKLLQRTPQLPQTFESVNQTIVFQPGDRMRMTCRYNSTGMDHTVYDGDHNKDEMCGLYLMFTSDTPIPAMECSGYYDSPTTFSPKGNYGIALGSHALLPAKAAAERRRALPGSGKEKAPIGQIGGISLTPDGRTLVVFHRGDRQWGDDTFS